MSNNIVPPIVILPIELLHRIFDDLDAETIIFSIRPVSKFFRSVVNTYDRYNLNLKLISKSNFFILCRLINSQNVISLTLSNDERTSNQIDWFISLVCLGQFTRLHSLTLHHVDEYQLNFILQRINLNILTSLSFKIRKYDETCVKTITNLFTQSNLYKLECGIETKRMSEISWPINCTIQYLIITEGMTLNNLLIILQCSPYLHTLIIKQKLNEMIDNIKQSFSFPITFRQLTSLTIEILNVTIDVLEVFLLLIPSLIYLKLVGLNFKIDGKRWERFIQTHLPHLNKFSFYFVERNGFGLNKINPELIINSFRTPFWIENKKWFVTCEYYILSGNIRLYSIPLCTYFMYYEPKSKIISSSTYPVTINNNSSIMNHVKSINLRLSEELADDIQQKRTTTNDSLFHKVTNTVIDFCGNWPLFSLACLSVFIDISKIVQIELNSDNFEGYNQNTWMDIGIFIQQAKNLSSLMIWNTRLALELNQSIDIICTIVPRHVKHLQIPMNNLNQIEKILKRCDNLSTIKLDINSPEFCQEMVKWVSDNTINSTCLKSDKMVSVWLGKKRIQLNKIKINTKRIKLTM